MLHLVHHLRIILTIHGHTNIRIRRNPILNALVSDRKVPTCVGLLLFERKRRYPRQEIYQLNDVLKSCNFIEFATVQVPLLKWN